MGIGATLLSPLQLVQPPGLGEPWRRPNTLNQLPITRKTRWENTLGKPSNPLNVILETEPTLVPSSFAVPFCQLQDSNLRPLSIHLPGPPFLS